MRTQELIHLHGLAVAVRGHLEAAHDVPADAFDRYDAYGVGPTALHRHEGDHRTALQHAMTGVVRVLEARSPTAADGEPAPPAATPERSD